MEQYGIFVFAYRSERWYRCISRWIHYQRGGSIMEGTANSFPSASSCLPHLESKWFQSMFCFATVMVAAQTVHGLIFCRRESFDLSPRTIDALEGWLTISSSEKFRTFSCARFTTATEDLPFFLCLLCLHATLCFFTNQSTNRQAGGDAWKLSWLPHAITASSNLSHAQSRYLSLSKESPVAENIILGLFSAALLLSIPSRAISIWQDRMVTMKVYRRLFANSEQNNT